jgi:hypothetical protein
MRHPEEFTTKDLQVILRWRDTIRLPGDFALNERLIIPLLRMLLLKAAVDALSLLRLVV